MNFGEKMKQIRKDKGLSQRELGERLGIKQQTVAQYESLENAPKATSIERISAALECDISSLLSINDATSKLKEEFYPEEKIADLQEYLEALEYTVLREESTKTYKKGFIDFQLTDEQQKMLDKYGHVLVLEKPYYIRKGNNEFRLSEKEFQNMEKEIKSSIEFQLWKYRIS